jgi:hypothetical protein
MIRRRGEQRYFLLQAHDGPPSTPLALQWHPRQGVSQEQLFVYGPVEDVPQRCQVAVDRRRFQMP